METNVCYGLLGCGLLWLWNLDSLLWTAGCGLLTEIPGCGALAWDSVCELLAGFQAANPDDESRLQFLAGEFRLWTPA